VLVANFVGMSIRTTFEGIGGGDQGAPHSARLLHLGQKKSSIVKQRSMGGVS